MGDMLSGNDAEDQRTKGSKRDRGSRFFKLQTKEGGKKIKGKEEEKEKKT